jgi:hypothetical protein
LFNSDIRQLLPVDYSKSLPEIAKIVTKAVIETTGKIEIITWQSYKDPGYVLDHVDSGLPLWTPDIYSCGFVPLLGLLINKEYGFQAAGSHPAVFHFLDNAATLQARGFVLGHICHVQRLDVIDSIPSAPRRTELWPLLDYAKECRNSLRNSFCRSDDKALVVHITRAYILKLQYFITRIWHRVLKVLRKGMQPAFLHLDCQSL